MRLVTGSLNSESPALLALQDHRLLLRWVYGGRLIVAMTVMLASLFIWQDDAGRPQVALLSTGALAIAAIFTALSALYSEKVKRNPPVWFRFLQTLADLLLVTLIVHITGAGESPLAAIYVVVITVSFLLLPSAGAITATVLGSALYMLDAVLDAGNMSALLPAALVVAVLLITAIVSWSIALRLKQAGAGSAQLVAQLQHMKLQAADILKNIRSGIITIDATGKLLQANPAASGILGVELDAMLDRPVLSRIHEASPELAEMLIRTIKRPTRINRGEAMMPRNGRNVPLGVTTTYAESGDGVATSATAIFQDITESKRMELLSLRAERLAAVAELSASLAHEIKNPLASIRSAVEQLARVEYATEDERTLASLVERESDRLSRLLSEFLEFARMQASHFRNVELVGIARGACALAASHPDLDDGVRVDFSASADEIRIDADEDLLHRAIFNLVLNAAQASPPDGTVKVRVALVPGNTLAGNRERVTEVAQITVVDGGAGIPPDVRARIFDPFFTTKSGGSGLGLSVVHRAISSHRGEVLVDSGSEGTKFTVLLPGEQYSIGEPA